MALDFSKYENKVPYNKETREQYREEDRRLYDLFKQDMFKDLGIENHPKRERFFDLAWSDGHASGYQEVYNIALEWSDLLT